MHVYLFSGLGVDDRAFRHIELPGADVTHIKWIDPLDDESMQDYAGRLIPQIKETNPILIGLSFGGMIAVEVAKLIQAEKIILISSAKGKENIPNYFRMLGKLGVHRLIPFQRFKRANRLMSWLFGVDSGEDRELLSVILEATDNHFLRWAIERIITWKNTTTPKNTIQLHGTADHILPIRFSDADINIVGGGHFMIVNRADELSAILNRLISNQQNGDA